MTMKKKTIKALNKALQLNKETLVRLDSNILQGVAGGGTCCCLKTTYSEDCTSQTCP
jgi:hypothetical protein